MNRYCRYILILLTLSFTMSANAKSKFTADIKMRNGHEYSGVEFTTPKSWDKEVAVKINGEKLKIKGDSIDHIVFWPTKYPDNPQIICWHTYGSIDNKTGEYKPNCGHNAKKGEPSNSCSRRTCQLMVMFQLNQVDRRNCILYHHSQQSILLSEA